MKKIVFLDRGTFPATAQFRPFHFEHELSVFDRTSPDEVAQRIADADIVITNKVVISADAIEGAKKLQLIAVAATGFNNIDIAACEANGVTVTNIRGYAIQTLPEHVFALILALRRNIVGYRQSVADGGWQRSGQFCYFDYPINNLAGSTLGIIGSGALGRAVARLGEAFGMNVLYAIHKGRTDMGSLYTPFEDVLARSDVLTLHLPLTPQTRNLIGAAEFSLMKRRPVLINTARGGLVDELALHNALRAGEIAGAGFDVAITEPPTPDNPLIRLLDLPNFILTPHVAWAGAEAIDVLISQLQDNIDLFVKGEIRNAVTAGRDPSTKM